ncbi:MAG: hypothetical protein HY809_06305 [Nitrospirae bacterium]|nr:hypothetical protein [Nitrospirota bacterium]
MPQVNIHKQTLVNVLGVVYVHFKSSDGGDIYLTRFAENFRKHLDSHNWYEKRWFEEKKIRLRGTGSVYKLPTKEVDGTSLDLVVKNCRVGEDVPLDTHTLQEFCDAEFNSPWEEFSLVMDLREGGYGPPDVRIRTQQPLGIYVPSERMQVWQSGRSRAKINRIRAKHPGIDLDILKQYKLIYQWIEGENIPDVFSYIDTGNDEKVYHINGLNKAVTLDLSMKGYSVADMKPEHIIISAQDVAHIRKAGGNGSSGKQIDYLYDLVKKRAYSVVDYELLLPTPEYEAVIKKRRRGSYLDDQRDRFLPTPLPEHLSAVEIFGVPYIFGHAESTGGRLWVVGRNARLFDFFLPERWRKTPSIRLSDTHEVFYTLTKDNIHLVWETSRVGEIPDEEESDYHPKITEKGINSPFEEFAIAHKLNHLGIPCIYARAIYMTGSPKIEASSDRRRYESHKGISDPDGAPLLQENHNYITIRGYYNGPDHWVAEQTGSLYMPVDLNKAVYKGIIDNSQSSMLLNKVKDNLMDVGYDGSLLKPDDLLLVTDSDGKVVKDETGNPLVVICNFQLIWKR